MIVAVAISVVAALGVWLLFASLRKPAPDRRPSQEMDADIDPVTGAMLREGGLEPAGIYTGRSLSPFGNDFKRPHQAPQKFILGVYPVNGIIRIRFFEQGRENEGGHWEFRADQIGDIRTSDSVKGAVVAELHSKYMDRPLILYPGSSELLRALQQVRDTRRAEPPPREDDGS